MPIDGAPQARSSCEEKRLVRINVFPIWRYRRQFDMYEARLGAREKRQKE